MKRKGSLHFGKQIIQALWRRSMKILSHRSSKSLVLIWKKIYQPNDY